MCSCCARDSKLAWKELSELACPPASKAGWAGAQVAGGDLEIQDEVMRVKAVLGEEDSQAIWTIIHCSLSQKCTATSLFPTPVTSGGAAMELDTILWELYPRERKGLDVECVLDVLGIQSLQGSCFLVHTFLLHILIIILILSIVRSIKYLFH